MVDINGFVNEFLTEEEVQTPVIAVITAEPTIKKTDMGAQIIADVRVNAENRKLGINKGNASKLIAAWGQDTLQWVGKFVKVRLPATPEERKTKSKFILEAVQPKNQASPLGLNPRPTAPTLETLHSKDQPEEWVQ